MVWDEDMSNPIEGPTAILFTNDSAKAYLTGKSIRKLEFVNDVEISSFVAYALVVDAPNNAENETLLRSP
jgi:hypothetical protein